MLVGYILDHALGLFLSILVITLSSQGHQWHSQVASDCLGAFQTCATFFAFSVEIATIVVLVREDFGINTSGMGDYTVRITQTVAMLVLLALIYQLLTSATMKTGDVFSKPLRLGKNDPQSAEGGQTSTAFSILVLCWALAFYPFFSEMNSAFAPSKISNKPGASITPAQFNVVRSLCFSHAKPITGTEERVMTAFVILAYIPLSLFVVGSIIYSGVEKNHAGSALHRRLHSVREQMSPTVVSKMAIAGLCATPLLACGLLWSIWRVRHAQEQLTASIGGADADPSWTFGQIVAVTIFAPVLVQLWNSSRSERGASSHSSPTHGFEKHGDITEQSAHSRYSSD